MLKPALATIACAFTLAAAAAPGASAATAPQGGGAANIVLSSTKSDGEFAATSRTLVTEVAGATVGPTNLADATSESCTGCHATAVAVQALIFAGSPRWYTPGNAATATNANCNSCGTYAYAWQYLVQVDSPVALSTATRDRIRELSSEIDAVARSVVPASIDDDALLDLELNGLTARLRSVVDEAVAGSGARPTGIPLERASIQRG